MVKIMNCGNPAVKHNIDPHDKATYQFTRVLDDWPIWSMWWILHLWTGLPYR